MKLNIKAERFKYLVLGAGGLGLSLRVILYATGIDGRGLLYENHWASVSLWILTAAVIAALLVCTRKLEGPARYEDAHPASLPAAVGAFGAMLGIAVTTFSEFSAFSGNLGWIVRILGIAAALSMGAVGVCRLTGEKPAFFFHGIVCIYFAIRMVSLYRLWISDPQLQDYFFYLSAYVALMLTAYHQAAFDADMGKHRSLWRFSLISVYLCCLSAHGSADLPLLLGCGLWAFTNLTHLSSRQRRKRPVMETDPPAPEA